MSGPHRLSQQPLVQRPAEGAELMRVPESEMAPVSRSAASYPPRPPPHVQQQQHPASRSGAYPPAHRGVRSGSAQPAGETSRSGQYPPRGSSAHRPHSGSGAGQRPSYAGGSGPGGARPSQQYVRASDASRRPKQSSRRRRRRDENARSIAKWEVGMALGIGAFDAFSDIFFGIDLFDVSRHQYDSLRFFELQFGVYVGGFVFLLGLIGVICLCIQVVYGSKDNVKHYMTTKVFIVILEDVPSLLIASLVGRLVLTTSAILSLVGSAGSMMHALYQVYHNQGRSKTFNVAAGMATSSVIAALMFFFVGRDPSECFIPSDGISSLLNSGMPRDHFSLAFVQKGGFLPAPDDFSVICTEFGVETPAEFTKCKELVKGTCTDSLSFKGAFELVSIECSTATEDCWGQNFWESWNVTYRIKGKFTWLLPQIQPSPIDVFIDSHPQQADSAIVVPYEGVNRCHKWDLSFFQDAVTLSPNVTQYIALNGAPSVSIALGPCHPNENNLDAGCGKWGSDYYVYNGCV